MKKNLYVMYAIAGLQGMVFYGPVATLYRQAQSITVFQITVIESVSLLFGILLEVPWGIIADKIGYRKTLICCSVLYWISKLIFWRATSFPAFLSERLILSVALAGLSGVDSSILYLSCQGKDCQKVFGLYHSFGMAGLFLAAGVFSVFLQDNYSLAGLLTVVSYGIAALFSFATTEVKQTDIEEGKSEPIWKTLQMIGKDRRLLLFLIAVAFFSETHQIVTVFLNQLQYERCGLERSTIGLLYMAATMLGLLGVYSSSVTKQVGIRGSFLLFCGLAAVSCFTLSLTQNAMLSVGGIFTLRVCNALFQPLQLEIQNRQIKTENRATALSVNSMFVNLIAVGINLVFGALSDWKLSAAFCAGGGMCILSLWLLLLGLRERRR